MSPEKRGKQSRAEGRWAGKWMCDVAKEASSSIGSAREGYTRCRNPLVVGGSFGLDGAHGVGAGQRRQRRSLVQFDGQGVGARHAQSGLAESPGQWGCGGGGWAKPRAVRRTGRVLPERTRNRAAGGQVPPAAGQAGRHSKGRRQDAAAGDSHAPVELHSSPASLWDRLKSSTRFIPCAASG